MKISSGLFYFQDKHFCLQCNGRLFQIEKRGEMGHIQILYAKLGNWLKKYRFRIYAIHNLHANDKMTPFALKILISEIYDA